MNDETKEVVCRVCQKNKMQISVKSTSGVCLECVSGGALVPPPVLQEVSTSTAKQKADVSKRSVPWGELAGWVKSELAAGKTTKDIFHAAKVKYPGYDPKKLRSTVYTTKSRLKPKEKKPNEPAASSSVSQATEA